MTGGIRRHEEASTNLSAAEISMDGDNQQVRTFWLTLSNQQHYLQSVLRERIVEHLFIGNALQRPWQRGVTDVEVLRSEFDAGGYDLVMSYGNVVPHIQLKTVTHGRRQGNFHHSQPSN